MIFYLSAVEGRVYQPLRLLNLGQAIGPISSDNYVTAYNPETQEDHTVQTIKEDELWKQQGNKDEEGKTNGYTFERLDPGEPPSETNFILTDVEDGDPNRVWRWLRTKKPGNDGSGEGTTWQLRPGVETIIRPPGTLPDSDPDPDGTFSKMNEAYWIQVRIREHIFPDYVDWLHTYLKTCEDNPANLCYVEAMYEQKDRVGRSGEPVPGYEWPAGAPELRIIIGIPAWIREVWT